MCEWGEDASSGRKQGRGDVKHVNGKVGVPQKTMSNRRKVNIGWEGKKGTLEGRMQRDVLWTSSLPGEKSRNATGGKIAEVTKRP